MFTSLSWSGLRKLLLLLPRGTKRSLMYYHVRGSLLLSKGFSFLTWKPSGLLVLDTLNWTKARSKVTQPMLDGPGLCERNRVVFVLFWTDFTFPFCCCCCFMLLSSCLFMFFTVYLWCAILLLYHLKNEWNWKKENSHHKNMTWQICLFLFICSLWYAVVISWFYPELFIRYAVNLLISS